MQKDATYKLLITGLRNAHAMESQAQELIERQIERTDDYPYLKARLSKHLQETKQQALRLEQCLDQCGETTSTVKDSVLATMANINAMGHSMANDEIIKNTLASNMFENFEIASYKSLLVMADAAGVDIKPMLVQSLREEEEMAEWMSSNIEKITRDFIALQQQQAA
jgi:ferritin-like metal-binding protein YciE